MKKRHLSLLSLLENEAIGTYAYFGSYREYNMIIPKDEPIGKIDIMGCIEETLHRILDNKGTEDDIRRILGAQKREEVDMDIVEENDIIDIDLGYVIPGSLLYASSDAGIFEDD